MESEGTKAGIGSAIHFLPYPWFPHQYYAGGSGSKLLSWDLSTQCGAL